MKTFLHRMLYPLQWALAVFPLFLLVSAGMDPVSPYVCDLVFLMAGTCIVNLKRHRIPVAFLGTAALAGYGFLMFHEPRLFVMPAACGVLLFYLCSAVSVSPSGWSAGGIVGLILYIAAQYCLSRTHLEGFVQFETVRVPILIGFLALGFLMLLRANTDSVSEAAGSHVLPLSVLRKNRILSVTLFLLVLLLSLVPVLRKGLHALWEGIKYGFIWLFVFLSSFLPEMSQEQGGGGGGGDMDFGGMGETAEPSPFWVFLEKVMWVIAGIAITVLLFFALRGLFRRLKVLIRRIREMLEAYVQSSGEDYVDEITDTRDTPESYERRARRKKRRRAFRNGMTNSEKVRFGYGRLIDQHPDWKASATARETLGVQDASTYEKVRYGNMDVSLEETEAFLKRVSLKKDREKDT